ncbi:hypothetical protein [Dryocola sp. BD626]|uniref:hypothetical protein n=1 Tax=Dryocola sp. BD626 TaxID=3133273 RepID=UPI003F4FA84B
MKGISYLLLASVLLTGCANGGKTSGASANAASQGSAEQAATYKETEHEARGFFNEYPQYTESRELEDRLMVEFQRALKNPANQGKSMYQMLMIAHQTLTAGR